MPSIPFDEFFSRFLSLYVSPAKSLATREKMEQVLHTARVLGADTTADLTIELAARYISAREPYVCNNTLRGELGYLRTAANYAFDETWLDRLPRWRRIWPRASKRMRKTVHPIEDVRKVLDHLEQNSIDWIGHRTYALGSFLAHTGVRLEEAVFGEREDLDLASAVYTVDPRRRLKTEGAARPVPLCPRVITDMRDWTLRASSRRLFPTVRGDKPWATGGELQRPLGRLTAAGIAVGVAEFTPHSLRHTFTTWGRRRWGIDRQTMADVLGHTDPETHERNYLHPEVIAELVAAVKNVSYRSVVCG
jgi:integrase